MLFLMKRPTPRTPCTPPRPSRQTSAPARSGPHRALRAALALTASLALTAQHASATWSILIVNTRTGEIALGSATCLTGFDLRANTPVLIPLVGAATAQSAVDATGLNRAYIRDRLAEGTPLSTILTGLSVFDADAHESRQYGIVSALSGGSALTFSGVQDGAWAGGRTGRIGDIIYAVQGNVLTGPCVVDAAVTAIETSSADLPTRLMLAMEAAKLMGGDGRCSCNAGGPEACGCPPATPGKSAHIAYMLSARAGDLEGCDGLYRVPTAPSGFAIADLTGDGPPEMIVTSGAQVLVYRNHTPPPALAGAPAFASNFVSTSAGSACRNPIVADFTGDGIQDVAVFSTSGSSASVLPGVRAALAFSNQRINIPLESPATAMASADFNGDNRPDLAIVPSTGSSLLVRLATGSGFTTVPANALGLNAAPTTLAAADIDGNGTQDLVIAITNPPSLAIMSGNGDGTFTRQSTLTLPASTLGLVARDLTGDGRVDLAVIQSAARQVRILTALAAGGFSTQIVSLTGSPSRLRSGDIDADGRPDLVALVGGTLVALTQTTPGTFVAQPSTALPALSGNVDLAVGDLDGNGAADVVTGSSAAVVTVASRAGRLTAAGGCATGDYYLNLNIANQQNSSPDPVLQLRTQFNAFRTAQAGRPDAIASTASFGVSCARPGTLLALNVTLRDLSGALVGVGSGITALQVAHAGISDGLSLIGPAHQNPDGTWTVPIVAGPRFGTDRLVITAQGGGRPVTLMPVVLLTIGPSADFDGDGATTPDDLATFIIAYFAAGPGTTSTDLDGDGETTPDDLADFVSAFFNPC